MSSVFVLHHVRADDEYADDAKLIGVYSTKESAQAAIERLKSQPGFRDHPAGFLASKYRLDQDSWAEGFISWDEAMEEVRESSQNAQS